MGETCLRSESARHANRVGVVLSSLCLVVFTLTSILPEMNTERYGQTSLTDYLPAAHAIRQFSGILNFLALALSGAAILHAFSFYATRESLNIGEARGKSQVGVWLPYILAWFVSVGFGASPGTSIYALVSVAMAAAVGLLLNRAYLATSIDGLIRWLFRAVVALSLIMGIMAPARAYAPYEVWPGGWFAGVDRLQGVLPHPNTLAWICALAVIIEVFGARSKLGFPFAGAAALALTLSGSRTASLALLAGLAIGGLYMGSRSNRTLRLMSQALAPVAAVVLVLVAGGLGLSAESFNGRQETWGAAIESFLANWFLGSGPGAYLVSDGSVVSVPYAHNQILQTAAELGVVGLLALFLHLTFLTRFVRSGGVSMLGFVLMSMWLVMFLSENLLRFAATGFYCQILFFQLALHLSSEGKPVPLDRAIHRSRYYA